MSCEYAGGKVETIGPTVLPAWDASGELDLSISDVFGADAALAALSKLMGESGPACLRPRSGMGHRDAASWRRSPQHGLLLGLENCRCG